MAITTNGKVSITNLQVGSSADLASIISDESGTGVLAFTNSPTFTTPTLGTASATAIELGHATDTTISRASAGVVAIEGVNVVTETATQTLTNKTLTSPVISTITNTGTLTLPTSTGTVALTSDITVTASSTNTLSNKSISLTTNTVSGTTAEFNTALSDGDFATLAGSETLSNKTLTAPKFADLGFIADANGNELVILDTVASAVNEITLANAATGNAPTLTASGGDTNVSLNLVPKGSGTVQIGGVNAVTTSSTDTLSNKTLTAPKFADLGFIADANGNELIILDTVTSAVNEVTLANAATGNSPTITASGGDTNIGITLTPKGSGNVTATALVYTQTLNTPSFSANAYTLALTDQGDILLASNGSTAGTISIPTNANAAFPIGTQITIVQTGSGQITINAVTSGTTTVNSTGATATAPKLRAQYSSATCVKTATDTWLVIGDLA